MNKLADRLVKIRKESGLNQTSFSLIMGVSRKTQWLYERGERAPDSNYLERLSENGYDAFYVLLGKSIDEVKEEGGLYESLSQDERSIVESLRALPAEDLKAFKKQTAIYSEYYRNKKEGES